MSDTLSLSLYNREDITLIYTALTQWQTRSGHDFSKMRLALQELLENTLQHAYDDTSATEIAVHVTFSLQECQLKVTLQEFGKPFDFTPYLSEPINATADHAKGFYHIYDLVDTFYFTTLGKKGKRFTLILSLENCTSEPQDRSNTVHKVPVNVEDMVLRDFEEHDAEAISQLIYKNYDYTYYKPYFYNPLAVKEANLKKKLFSFIASYHQQTIGHFALVPRANTNLAEVAIAVVAPEFKGVGIMNHLFVKLIAYAQEHHYRAIFGEAIMLHPYSQKANLKKGMFESALVLGLVPSDIEIEHNLKLNHRSGVLVGYLLFNKIRIAVNVPSKYKHMFTKTYTQFDLTTTAPLATRTITPIQTHIDRELNLSTLQIDAFVDESELHKQVETLMLEQTDMIYADINLHRISGIDSLIATLNNMGFFYSGIMFDFYHDEDYLRLQKVCSTNIDTQELVTYSPFASELLDFIREDQEKTGSSS